MLAEVAALNVAFGKKGEDKELDSYLESILPYMSVYKGGWGLYGMSGKKSDAEEE